MEEEGNGGFLEIVRLPNTRVGLGRVGSIQKHLLISLELMSPSSGLVASF